MNVGDPAERQTPAALGRRRAPCGRLAPRRCVSLMLALYLGCSVNERAAAAKDTALPEAPPPPATHADPTRSEHWYGYQTLLADAGALLVLVAGVATNGRDTSQGIVIASGVAYSLGGPIVHLAHGQAPASLASLG